MKTSCSKLFRKIAINRRSNRVSSVNLNKEPCEIPPIEEWWKARNVKDTQ